MADVLPYVLAAVAYVAGLLAMFGGIVYADARKGLELSIAGPFVVSVIWPVAIAFVILAAILGTIARHARRLAETHRDREGAR